MNLAEFRAFYLFFNPTSLFSAWIPSLFLRKHMFQSQRCTRDHIALPLLLGWQPGIWHCLSLPGLMTFLKGDGKHIFHKQVSCKRCMRLSWGNVSWDIHGHASELRQAVREPWIGHHQNQWAPPCLSFTCACGKWFPIALLGFFAMQFVKDTEMKVHSHKAQLLYKTSISPFFFLVKGCWFRLVKKYSFNLKACHVLIC